MRIQVKFFIFILFISLLHLLSLFKEESYIDGKEVLNACVAFKAFVTDDIRDVTAPISFFLLILPFFIILFKERFKKTSTIIFISFLLLYWLWRFFIRLNIC
ncbi:DUF2645 family protein [Dickeya zeae]|uniref:DUF2645 family protein n=1 Tax=Dickeya zeae TaxID=204042 RepID=A0ABX8VYA2_9GAMM|nr:DUF2645 family protein [Dickeya zeae]QYM92772.1 DUF2645 family protein [Dickeya zeae]